MRHGLSGAIVSPANPSYTTSELSYQLGLVNAKAIIAHPSCLKTALEAARQHGLTEANIYVLRGDAPPGFSRVDDLVVEGLNSAPNYVERKLEPGEGKTKLAFLSFSSGTTGKPKVRCLRHAPRRTLQSAQAVSIPHYALISNVIQIAAFNRAPDGSLGRYSSGQTSLAGMSTRTAKESPYRSSATDVPHILPVSQPPSGS